VLLLVTPVGVAWCGVVADFQLVVPGGVVVVAVVVVIVGVVIVVVVVVVVVVCALVAIAVTVVPAAGGAAAVAAAPVVVAATADVDAVAPSSCGLYWRWGHGANHAVGGPEELPERPFLTQKSITLAGPLHHFPVVF